MLQFSGSDTRAFRWSTGESLLHGVVITARSQLRKVLFLALSVTFLCTKYLGNLWTDLHRIHAEDVFGPSLGRV